MEKTVPDHRREADLIAVGEDIGAETSHRKTRPSDRVQRVRTTVTLCAITTARSGDLSDSGTGITRDIG